MKLACLQLTPHIFIELCKHGVEKTLVVDNKLPEDTQFIRAGHDQFGNLFLVLQSDSFEEIENGGKMPMLENPVFSRKNNA